MHEMRFCFFLATTYQTVSPGRGDPMVACHLLGCGWGWGVGGNGLVGRVMVSGGGVVEMWAGAHMKVLVKGVSFT